MVKTQSDKERRSKLVRAFITKTPDGGARVVRESELEKYRVARNDEKDFSSQQIKESDLFDLEGQSLIKPPYNLFWLWRFMELCTEHSSCVRQKASDVCGLGWKIVKRDKKGNADLKNKEILENFFTHGNDNETFTEVAVNVWTDFEAVANSYLEVVKNSDGKPGALYHIPAHTVRCTKDPDIFIQIRDQKKKIFRRFGSTTSDAVAKMYVEEIVVPELQEIAKAKKKPDTFATKGWNYDEATSEIIQIKNYSSRSSFYGIPEWLPSVGAILGNIECRDYNLKFFDNNGVPHYAIIIKGADLDEDLEKVISTFFSQEIRGDAHKTLIIPINSQEVEVTFEKLSTDIKDASFRMYKQDNRDEILRAHRVPFSRMNVATPGKLGGSSDETESENYKKSIIAPKQLIFQHRLNETLIKIGFGIKDWVIEFVKLDATDVETDMRINTAYVKSGIKTINESRADCGLDPVDGGDRLFVNTATGMVFLDEMATMSSSQAIGTNAQKKEEDFTQKALESLNKTLEKIVVSESGFLDKAKGVIQVLSKKLVGKKNG